MTAIIDRNKAYPLAVNETNQIVISTSIAPIKIIAIGVLQETLKFSVESNYEQIMSLNEYFGDTNKAANLALDKSVFTTGIATRRYYKGGSYIRIEPKIRVVDWDGTGAPVATAEALMNASLPQTNKNLEGFATTIKEALIAIAKTLPGSERLNSGLEFAGAAALLGANTTGILTAGLVGGVAADTDLVKAISSNIGAKTSELASTALTNNPQPVFVTISNYYANQFLIENVSVEFSKEMTDFGPLYCDISLSLATRDVAQKGQSGLLNKQGSRVRRK